MENMEHLPEHEHAFLDANGYVINIATFDGHNHEMLNQIATHLTAKEVVCCCNNGKAAIGDQWDSENQQWITNARGANIILDENLDFVVADVPANSVSYDVPLIPGGN